MTVTISAYWFAGILLFPLVFVVIGALVDRLVLRDRAEVHTASGGDEQRSPVVAACRTVVEVDEAAGTGVAYTLPPPRLRRRFPVPLFALLILAATTVESARTWAREVRESFSADRSPGWDTELGHLLLTSDAVEPDHECVGVHCGHETVRDHEHRGRHRDHPTGQWPTLTTRAA